jgi:hypothetical protein
LPKADSGLLAFGDQLWGKALEVGEKDSPPFEIKGERFEYHWYEHPGIGKVEMKRKQIKQR